MTDTKSRGWLTCALVLLSIIAWGCASRSREPDTASSGPREMNAAERAILANARRENFSTNAAGKAAIAEGLFQFTQAHMVPCWPSLQQHEGEQSFCAYYRGPNMRRNPGRKIDVSARRGEPGQVERIRTESREGMVSGPRPKQKWDTAGPQPKQEVSFEAQLIHFMGRDAELDRYVRRDGRKIRTRSYVVDENQVMRVSHWLDCDHAGSLDTMRLSCTLVVVTFPY